MIMLDYTDCTGETLRHFYSWLYNFLNKWILRSSISVYTKVQP